MLYNTDCHLWPNKVEHFFQNADLLPLLQIGPHCVATALAILTCSQPKLFQDTINTQDPVSWSSALQQWNMKLAFCPNDARKLKYFLGELVELDDLFTLSYYTTLDKHKILGDPNDKGWVCGSHIVILHRSEIIDPQTGDSCNAFDHECNNFHTKRIFRVVPSTYHRGI